MPYWPFECSLRSKPELTTAGAEAAWLWCCGEAYAREHLTDGVLLRPVLAALCPALAVRDVKRCAELLVRVNLWERERDGYRICRFLDRHPSRAEVESARQADRDRKRIGKPANSSRNPAGKSPNSGRIPDDPTRRIPDDHPLGIPDDTPQVIPDEAPLRAGGRGRSSPSPLPLASVLGSEGSKGTTAGPTPQRGGGLIVNGLQWERQHGQHVTGFCDWVCWPLMVRAEFVNRVAAAGSADPDGEVDRWALAVRRRYEVSGTIPGDDIFAFWRHEWQREHGTNKPSSSGGRDVLAGLREA